MNQEELGRELAEVVVRYINSGAGATEFRAEPGTTLRSILKDNGVKIADSVSLIGLDQEPVDMDSPVDEDTTVIVVVQNVGNG